MNAQHTPGPWIQIGNNVGVEIGIVATVHSPKLSTLEEFANARLIAAAPDLLEALVELTNWYIGHTGLPACSATAAIAKATGGAK